MYAVCPIILVGSSIEVDEIAIPMLSRVISQSLNQIGL